MAQLLRWRGEGGVEHAAVALGAEGVVMEGVVVGRGEDGGSFGVGYRVVCDGGWRVREVEVREMGGGRLVLRSDGMGGWRDEAGMGIVELSGCVDVDLTATPMTNTLPVRRVGLRVGESATVRVAYVGVPGLRVSVSEQRYTRVAERVYRFELVGGAFVREIVVDGEGFVVEYPGLFWRE